MKDSRNSAAVITRVRPEVREEFQRLVREREDRSASYVLRRLVEEYVGEENGK